MKNESNDKHISSSLFQELFDGIKNSFDNASSFQKTLESLIIGLLVLAIYLFTANSLTQDYALYLYLVAFILLAGIFVIQLRREKTFHGSFTSTTFKIILFALITGILLWVANTGGFLSPFAYLLYLAGISLGFLFSPSLSLTFVLLIVGVLIPYVGTVNARLDLGSLLSLFIIIPLGYLLRREYLRSIERQKKILILQEENRQFKDKVDEVLSNKVTKIAVDLREPINDITQIALYSKKHTGKDRDKDLEKILTATKKALGELKEFEEAVTGKTLVSSQKK